MTYPIRRWALHACVFDSDCRQYGAPMRVHLTTPWLLLGVALTPDARFARVGRRSTWTFVQRPR